MDSSRFVTAVGADTGAVEPTVAPPVERPRPEAPPHRTGFAANLVPLAVASALLMEFLDSTALSTALPTLAKAFHTDPVHLKLALTSYILALAVFAPASGWVADRFGAKRVFLCAMTVFLAGSALCGQSHSLGELIAFRIVQGIGGAMMTPVGRLIVVSSAPRDRFVSAMSWFTMPGLIGPLLGPPLSGLILGVASWPWIFYVNIPVGILGMAAVASFVPKIAQPDPGRFDFAGFLLIAFAIVSLTAVSETAGVGLAPWPLELALALAGFAALAGFVRHVARAARPVLNLKLLADRSFRASISGGTLVRLGLGATPLLLPLLLQIGFGWSPVKAGLLTISQSAGAMLLKPVAPALLRRLGYRTVLIGSAVGTAITISTPAFFRADTPAGADRAAARDLRLPAQRPLHLGQRPGLRRRGAGRGQPRLHPVHRRAAGRHEPGGQRRRPGAAPGPRRLGRPDAGSFHPALPAGRLHLAHGRPDLPAPAPRRGGDHRRARGPGCGSLSRSRIDRP